MQQVLEMFHHCTYVPALLKKKQKTWDILALGGHLKLRLFPGSSGALQRCKTLSFYCFPLLGAGRGCVCECVLGLQLKEEKSTRKLRGKRGNQKIGAKIFSPFLYHFGWTGEFGGGG